MEKELKLKMFINEINDIKDEKLQKFAEEVIGNADDYFFSVAASSSGKYHPQFDLGKSGLVRHTRCVAFFAQSMAESMDFNEHDRDLLIIAALAHDIKKQGDNTGHTVWEHPRLAKEYIMDLQTKHNDLISVEDAVKIANAVHSHMGKWQHHPQFNKRGDEECPMPANDFEKALQAADYVASRKEILDFKFRDCENVEVPEVNVTTNKYEYNGIPGDYVLSFGKKKGMSIRDIHESDKKANPNRGSYIEWMVGNADFHCKDAQDIARKYLNDLQEGREVLFGKKEDKVVFNQVDESDSLPF